VIDPAELEAWLRLLLVPGIGREGARQLLATFGSPQGVTAAPASALQTVAGDALAAEIQREPADLAQRLADVQAWLAAGPQRQVITLGDAAYPHALLESPDPPLLLYVTGDLSALSARCLAVVGSRRPSAQGRDNAHDFARQFAAAGYVVVSGLALGVDGAAHEGALAGGGRTVAVVGTGPDRVYPKRHLDLARRIAVQGAIVSEFLPGTPPLPSQLPAAQPHHRRPVAGHPGGRSRAAVGLADHGPPGQRSRARGVRHPGLDPRRAVARLPCPHPRRRPAGGKRGRGAGRTAPAGLPGLAARPAPAAVAPDPPLDPLLDALGHDPVSVDSLQARTGRSTADLLGRLLELELDGQVARLPGGLYQRRVQA
jgi:DNA processing protein